MRRRPNVGLVLGQRCHMFAGMLEQRYKIVVQHYANTPTSGTHPTKSSDLSQLF